MLNTLENVRGNTQLDKDRLKILCFDFFMDLIYVIIILSSYILTTDILSDASNTNAELDFMRGAFVFIAPCALEAVNTFTSQEKEDKYQDKVEVILSMVGIFTTGILVLILIFDKGGCAKIINVLIAAYPVKFVSNGVFDFIHLFQERKVKA